MSDEIKLSPDRLRSLFNSRSMQSAYDDIPPLEHDLHEVDLVSLMKPTKQDWRLRVRLWELIHKALDKTNAYDVIYNVDIYEGILSAAHFKQKLKKRYMLTFLFRPIEKFADEVETMLAVTRTRMWQLINHIRAVDSEGRIDMSQANLLLKIHDRLVDRKMGTVRHLIEMKKIQLNVNAGGGMSDDLELIDQQIAQLRPEHEVERPQISEASKVKEGASG